jgi:hypothetical protein
VFSAEPVSDLPCSYEPGVKPASSGMKDDGIAGLEARGPPPQLPLNAIKPSQLATAASATMGSKVGASEDRAWNTKNLALRLGADFISAASAAVLVAPIISIIDR